MADIDVPANVPQSDDDDGSSTTERKPGKFSYMWEIEGREFRRQSRIGGNLISPNFSAGREQTFSMMLVPFGVNISYASLHLDLMASKNRTVKLQISFSLLDNENKKFHTIGEANEIHEIIRGKFISFIECISKQQLMNKINGISSSTCRFKILCEGEIVSLDARVSRPNPQIHRKNFDVPPCMAFKNIGLLFDTEKFSDVTLATADREFRAHKAILAAQSPVFSAMFEHEMAEQKENRVKIEDIEGDVIEVMLRFIYTGDAKLDGMESELLMAAEKYQLDRLKIMCERELAVTMTIDNAIDTLILADIYSAHKLKAITMDFVIQQSRGLMETQEFKSLFVSHPLLAAEMFRVLAKKRKS